MSREDYLSKSSPKQALEEHIADVMRCYDELMERYGDHFSEKEKSLLRLACLHHDDGKINTYFQNRIRCGGIPDENEIPHGHLSMLLFHTKELEKTYTREEIKALYTAVYHHHDRKDHTDEKWFKEQAKKAMEAAAADYFGPDAKLRFGNMNLLLFRAGYADGKYDSSKLETYVLYMVIKGLLNKLDYRGSAGDFEVEQPNLPGGAAAEVLRRFGNELLPAQRYMADHREENLIVVAPTGSGKTEGALLWLGESKGFYTLPLKVSSNAIFDRITRKYGYSPCALLHSDSFGFLAKDEEEEDAYQRYRRMRKLSYPLTICTVDQIFSFVFKSPGTEIFGATLRYSRLVIDEIQMYNSEITAFLLYGLELVAKMGGRYLIMTATFPRFLRELMNTEMPPSMEYFMTGRTALRHRIDVRESDFDLDEILSQASGKKVLVIVNTVGKAQELYEYLKEKTDAVWLLHSRFTVAHRRLLEEAILDFSEAEGQTGIWISTQIVEASLDIDFDVLYTEGCTIDSLFQRFGRCYRGREYRAADANIHIHFNGNDAVYDRDIVDFSLEALKKRNGSLLSEEDKIILIDEVFEPIRLKNTAYFDGIIKALHKIRSVIPGEILKEEVEYAFRHINSVSVIPDAIYDCHMDEIDDILAGIKKRDIDPSHRLSLQEKLQQWSLSVNPYSYGRYIDGVVLEQPKLLRIHCVYEFDEASLAGRGLVKELPCDNLL